MAYEFRAILSNRRHQENGQASASFPIPSEDYDDILDLLRPMEIGAAARQDCMIDEIDSPFPILQRLENSVVNLDELDYLAKRLDSFCKSEGIKFQAMAEKMQISNIRDFINLTFCCQQTTVITDFSDLEAVGRSHYMNLHDGCASTEELNNLDGHETALLLIEGGGGVITPYGVVYDNGMKLEQLYDGRHFPEYWYRNVEAVVKLNPLGRPEVCEYLYLPCPDSVIGRTLQRLGVSDLEMCETKVETVAISDAICSVFTEEFDLRKHMGAFNQFTRWCKEFGNDDDTMDRFHTVFDSVYPETPEKVVLLAQHFHEFTVVNGISTPEEYGRYLIQESGNLHYDTKLDGYIDYEKYGKQVVQSQNGVFADRGYVAYLGDDSQVEEMFLRGTKSWGGHDMARPEESSHNGYREEECPDTAAFLNSGGITGGETEEFRQTM